MTTHAAWSVTSGPGAAAGGTYVAPLTIPGDTAVTIHVSYIENSVTKQADKNITVQHVCHHPFADVDGDGDVDQDDFGFFERCFNPSGPVDPGCSCFDRPQLPGYPNGDGKVDQSDLLKFEACVSGPGIPADPSCDD